MGKAFAAIAIGLAVALAGVTAYFTIPAGYSLQLPSFLQFGSAEPAGPTAQLTYAVNQDALRDWRLEEASERMAATLREATPGIRYSGRGVRDGVVTITLADPSDRPRALDTLEATLAQTEPDLTINPRAGNVIEARLTPAYLQSLTRQAASQSMQVIRRRIDPTGSGRADLALTSDYRIVVRVSGVQDADTVRRRIGQEGLLTFHLVRQLAPDGRAPAGATLVEPYPGFDESFVAIEPRAQLTGEHLVRVDPRMDPQTEEWVLAFELDREGTRLFCRITRDNVGERFAILLDNRVLTAPVIQEPICGGSGQISGNFTAQAASDLAIMLNAGALPAPLLLIDERIVGNPN